MTSPRSHPLIIATAIVIAGGLIGLSLYLGLRRSAPPGVVAPPAATAPPTAVLPREAVEQQVRAALEAQRPRFRTQCWDPAVAQTPTPATSHYEINVSLDPRGREVGRGISEVRGVASRADVAQCLRAIADAPLRIAPPGQTITVVVALDLP